METLQPILNYIPIATVFGVLLPIVKIIVNSLTAHELDKLLNTPWNRFVESSILIIISSIMTTFVIVFGILEIQLSEIENEPRQAFALVLVLFVIVAIILYMIRSIITEFFKELGYRFDYYIMYKSERWKVERAKSNELLYIKIEDRMKRVVLTEDMEFIKELNQSKLAKKLCGKYSEFKYFNGILLSLILVILIALIISYINSKTFAISLTPYATIIILLLFILCIGNNTYKNEIEKNKDQKERED